MRKKKRFTPSLIDRFHAEGRGTGTYGSYISWHQVRRGEPGSRGLSTGPLWYRDGRRRHLLSHREDAIFLHGATTPAVDDCRENFPLSLDSSRPAMAAYVADWRGKTSPGTVEIAEALRIRHPRVSEPGRSCHWVLTTDLLFRFLTPEASWLVAVAVKPSLSRLSPRQRALLLIERAFWIQQDVTWLLITDTEVSRTATNWLRMCEPDAMTAPPPSQSVLTAWVETFLTFSDFPQSSAIRRTAERLGQSEEAGTRSFHQAVWHNALLADRSVRYSPTRRVALTTSTSVRAANPVWSARSANLDETGT